jgi:hypothetical protein
VRIVLSHGGTRVAKFIGKATIAFDHGQEQAMKKTTELEAKENTAMQTAKPTSEKTMSPLFVEAEKMFERFAEITKETAQRAFEFFRDRGGEFGR